MILIIWTSNISVFSPDSLAARLLAALHQSRVTRHRVGRGAAVFRQGDPAAAVFLIETGRVRLVRVLADGTPLILYVADGGRKLRRSLPVGGALSLRCHS